MTYQLNPQKMPKRHECIFFHQNNMDKNILSSIILKSPQMEVTQMFINSQMGKSIVIEWCNGILQSNEKGWATATCDKEESQTRRATITQMQKSTCTIPVAWCSGTGERRTGADAWLHSGHGRVLNIDLGGSYASAQTYEFWFQQSLKICGLVHVGPWWFLKRQGHWVAG